MKGTFIVFDGIDGSGKTSALEAVAVDFARRGKKTFTLTSWSEEHHALPDIETLKPYDVIISAEPTRVWVGAAIRKEMVRNGTNYSARDIAAAFALDREILYTRSTLPARAQGKIVLQDRSITTSMVYQPIQKPPVPLPYVLSLSGNQLALKHPPDLLVIASCAADIALKRLSGRTDKKDNVIFERLAFLKQSDRRFHAPWFQKFWQSRGTKVVYLNAEQSQPQVAKDAITIVQSFLRASLR